MKIKIKKFKFSNAMSTCKTLSSLDDWTLLQLFDHVPLADLLRLGQVNHRFNQIVKRNCLQPVRHHLVLVIGRGGAISSSDQFNCITVVQLNYNTIKAIRQLLPGTTSLKIVYNYTGDVFDWVIYLLEGWIDQLEVLNLVFIGQISSAYTVPLFDLLNRMHQLKELHLKDLDFLATWLQLDLPIISQLQVFSFSNFDCASWILPQLRTHATHTLKEVNLSSYFYDWETIPQLLEMPPHLAATFQKLDLRLIPLDFDDLVALCQRYRSLQELNISAGLLTIRQLIDALVMLPQLTKLALGNLISDTAVDSQNLVPLPTVTSLKLWLHLTSHADLDQLHLGVLFPNLVTLDIILFHCCECGYDFFSQNRGSLNCLEMLQVKATFGELLPKLRTVLFHGEPLPKKVWQPSPPKTLVDRMSSFFCRIPKRLRKLAGKAFGSA